MKKLFLLCLLTINLLNAQVNNTPPQNSATLQTPSIVANHFNTDYPNTVPTWTINGTDYMARYRDNKTNTDRYVIYDQYGTIIGNGEHLSMGTYPNSIGDYYTQKYPNETYEVWSSVDGTGNKTYYTDRESERIWFDKEGNYKNKVKTKNKPEKKSTKK